MVIATVHNNWIVKASEVVQFFLKKSQRSKKEIEK